MGAARPCSHKHQAWRDRRAHVQYVDYQMALRQKAPPGGSAAAGRRYRGRLIVERSTQTDAHIAVSLVAEVVVQSALSRLGGTGPSADSTADEALHALIAGVRYAQATGVGVAGSLLPTLKRLAAQHDANVAQEQISDGGCCAQQSEGCSGARTAADANLGPTSASAEPESTAEVSSCQRTCSSASQNCLQHASVGSSGGFERGAGTGTDGGEDVACTAAVEWRLVQQQLLSSTWHDEVSVQGTLHLC